jgi:hypothetical protein
MGAVQLGTVPDWLSMVGTLGAFAVGGALLWREIQRNHAAERYRERDQASRVIVWMEERRSETSSNSLSAPAGGSDS